MLTTTVVCNPVTSRMLWDYLSISTARVQKFELG